MTKPKYSTKNIEENCAKAYGRNLPISTKTSIEICSFLRGKSVDKAIALLTDVLAFKQAVPYRRFTDGVGHRKGNMASGRFPQKASQYIKETLESAKANANNKGLSDDLKIVHLCAQKASSPFHQGRQRRRVMKRTHIEVVLKEVEGINKKKEQKPKKVVPKPQPTPKKQETVEQKPKTMEPTQPKVEEKPISQESKTENVKPAEKPVVEQKSVEKKEEVKPKVEEKVPETPKETAKPASESPISESQKPEGGLQ